MFSCEFYEVSKNVFLTEYLRWLLSNKREMRAWTQKDTCSYEKCNSLFLQKTHPIFFFFFFCKTSNQVLFKCTIEASTTDILLNHILFLKHSRDKNGFTHRYFYIVILELKILETHFPWHGTFSIKEIKNLYTLRNKVLEKLHVFISWSC